MKDIEESEIHVVESTEQVNEFFRWLGNKRDWLAWDTETGGLEFWKQPLRLFQIGDVDTAWVFRADRWLGVMEEAFQKYTGKWVGQNVGFDIRFTKAQAGLDLPWTNQHDTRTMAHILDPTKSTSLKALGARFLSPRAKKLQGTLQAAMAKQGWGWADIPLDFPIYTGYAGVDCILTARIARQFWPEIESQYKSLYELEMEVARVCSNMEYKGTLIDLEYCKDKYEALSDYCNATEEWCVKEYGVRPSETQKVATKLVSEGVDLSKTTATGLWSMDKDVLDGLDHPLAKAVLGHRRATKVKSSYFENFIHMHDDSVLHPSINTLGARTGRMSAQNPALQTLPRGRVVRDAFIPRPGNIWLSVDFNNIEMKLLAHFCQDPKMLEAARTSDMHLEMAKIAYGDAEMTKSDPRRQTFKNANFAKAYVAGAERFAWTAGLEIDSAKEFLNFYDEMFPGVKTFQKKVERVAKSRLDSEGEGYVSSPAGRRHTAKKDKHYTLVNYLIQGTAADVFKRSLVDLDLAGFGDYLLLPVHDEADFEVPVEEAKDMVTQIEETMTQNEWSVPLTVSSSFGMSWGEAK